MQVRPDPARLGAGVAALLVPFEGLPGVDDTVEAGKQDLAEGEAVDAEARHVVGRRDRFGELRVEGLVGEDHPGRRPEGGRDAEPVQVVGETGLQGSGTRFLQPDPVALAAECGGGVPLVHRDADAGFRQSLRQAQAAEAAADDDGVQCGEVCWWVFEEPVVLTFTDRLSGDAGPWSGHK